MDLVALAADPTVGLVIISAAIAILEEEAENPAQEPVSRKVIHQGGYLAALQYADRLLRGSDKQFEDLFRLNKPTFNKLCRWLRFNTSLNRSRYQTLEQKVMIFLFLLASGAPQREASHLFMISQSSVSTTFHEVLDPMREMHITLVIQPDDNFLSPEIEFSTKFCAFSGCIGAIDGSHVAAHIPIASQKRFWNRKGKITQNVLAAVRMDGKFSYVLAGAEGSLHDANLCRHALSRNFRIPPGRFYLGDAGFGIQTGLLVPYPNTRYHLNDWRHAPNKPQTKEELYNLRHAQLRNVVERMFGTTKRKFKILRENPAEYEFRDQVKLVYAVTGLWNFTRPEEELELDSESEEFLVEAGRQAYLDVSSRTPRELREFIATRNWDAYKEYLARGDDPEAIDTAVEGSIDDEEERANENDDIYVESGEEYEELEEEDE